MIQDQKSETATPKNASSFDSTFKHPPTASIMCDCFGTFEETMAASKTAGSLLVIAECNICGRSFLKTIDSGLQVVGTRPQSPLKEISRLGSGRRDPFGSYAIEMSPYMHGLLDHREINWRSTSVNPDINFGQ
jgi:hypothetical protein